MSMQTAPTHLKTITKYKNFNCTTESSLSLQICHIKQKRNFIAFQILVMAFYPKSPFQSNNSITDLGITQLIRIKHKTNDHESLANSQ